MEENTNTYVVDASFVLGFMFSDEKENQSMLFFERFQRSEINFISTFLLLFEVGNALKSAVKRKRINGETADFLYRQFCAMEIENYDIDPERTLTYATENDLTFYDASYISLALEKNIPLLTHDEKLKRIVNKLLPYSEFVNDKSRKAVLYSGAMF